MLAHDAPFSYPGIIRGRRAITSTDTATVSDRGICIDATSGTFSVGATAAATLGSGYAFGLYNSGSGVVTFDPTGGETIQGPTGTATTFALSQGQGAVFQTDGSNWKVVLGVGLVDSGTASVSQNTVPKGSATAGVLTNSSITDNGTTITLGEPTVINGSLGAGTGVAPAANVGFAWAAPASLSGATLLGHDNSTMMFPSCTTARGFSGSVGTTNAVFTITSLVGYYAGANTKGASATVTRSASFHSRTQTVGGTGNFGFVYNNNVALPTASGTFGWYNDTGDAEYHGTGTNTFASTTDATSLTTGATTSLGGASFAKNIIGGQGLGLGVSSTATAAGTTTLTNASRTVQTFTGTTTQTIQFPAANLFGAGIAVTFVINNQSTGTVTPTRAGSDTFQGGGTTDPVLSGASQSYRSDGVSVWLKC